MLAPIDTDPAPSRKSPTRLTFSSRTSGDLARNGTWGNVPYPVRYAYDDAGRRTGMWTYRDSGLDFSTDTWPAGATEAAGDKTTWNYEAATGWLTSKVDAAGNATVYTYYADGKLESRRWARTQGAGLHPITLYTYYPTGELQKVDYRLGSGPSSTVDDPGTVDVEYTYDALGRVETVTDAVGTRTMVYDPDTLQLVDEVIDGQGDFDGVYDVTLRRKYEGDGAGEVPGRPAGLEIVGDPYDVTYGYEPGTGRFQRVAWNVDGHTDEAVYGYVANSDLLAGMATISGQTTTYGWEPNRDLRTSVVNAFDAGAGSDIVSRFDYRYDAVGRRTDVVTTGSAFGGAGNEELSLWAYNDRSEVIGSSRHAGTDPDAPGAAVPTEARSYQFDPIGNRTSALDQDGANSVAYAPNSLNQYDNVDGIALSHDLDGNMLGDGSGMALAYNGENRMVQAARGQEFASTYTYDHLGRRVRKEVDADDDGTWDYRTYFVYDGWNVIRETREANGGATTTKRYVWGLDLSGSMHGAGGVGGLHAVVGGASQGVFTFDGNGNVSEVVASGDGGLDAHYEYDAFGNAIAVSGPRAEENSWRFSTKPVDEESGYSYYGHRWYSAALGRWTRKDPAEESGGQNLYAFVGNSPVTTIDLLGEKPLWEYAIERMNEIKANQHNYVGSEVSEDYVRQLANARNISRLGCISYGLNVIAYAYDKLWRETKNQTYKERALEIAKVKWRQHGTQTTQLLQSWGWRRTFYWSPDTRNLLPGHDDQNRGDRAWLYNAAKRRGVYLGAPAFPIRVTDFAVNYNPYTGADRRYQDITTRDTAGLAALRSQAFGFGMTRGDRHTFLMVRGVVNEVHWNEPERGRSSLLEATPLENWDRFWTEGVVAIAPAN